MSTNFPFPTPIRPTRLSVGRLLQISGYLTLAATASGVAWALGRLVSARRRDRLLGFAGQASRIALARLRGAWVKAAQLSGPIVASSFGRELSSLRDHARASRPATVRRMLRAELGPLEEVFASFDAEHPLGVASIGQVHQAVLLDGSPVAVKVQHPRLREVVVTDLWVLERLLRIAGRWWPAIDVDAAFSELSHHLRTELDSLAEARHQRRFAEHFRDHPRIHVPNVRRATDRVIISDLAAGRALTDTDLSLEQRDAAGTAVFEFWLACIAEFHDLQIDIHAGNFLVTDDGALVALDFGQVDGLDLGEVERFTQLAQLCVAAEDSAALLGFATATGLATDEPSALADLEGFVGALHAFFHDSGPRRLDRGEVTALMRRFATETSRALRLSPTMLVMLRALAGAMTIAGIDLEATADWGRMARDLWLEAPVSRAA